MTPAEVAIRALVDRETEAWNRPDAAGLVELFHPDMVWAWPPTPESHDPATWVLPMGRFDRARWRASWQELFDTHRLEHNRRSVVRVTVTEQQDGGLAVVDVDTLWRHRVSGAPFSWKGRAGKVYTKVGERWCLISHTGLLYYQLEQGVTRRSGGRAGA